MLVEINKVKVNERIRKDFGDIQELAEDIKTNGLINPPVVTPEYELIAGERRLRALKELGYNQIEVRVMTVNDALHQLKLEISENENRKDFSFNEKMTWAKMLEVEYGKIAKENSLKGITCAKDFAMGRVSDVVSQEVGFGSGRNYEKAKYISENADEETIKQLDDGQLSINKAYIQLKEQLSEKENQIAGYELKLQKIKKLEDEIIILNRELINRPKEEIEVKPLDYDETKKSLDGYKKDYSSLRSQYESKIKEISDLKEQIKTINSVTEEEQYKKKLKDGALFFCARVNDFIEKTGGFVWLSENVNDLPEYERKSYIKAVDMVENWANAIKMNINK